MDLSVIIPVYNHEDYIEKCINTILEDFPENSEIIIIDDVCTDSSIDKIRKIGSDKIKIYRNEKNMGCAYNLNKGIELAQGNYIGINYSDDFVEKGFYKKMLKVAKEQDADIVCANIADYNEKTKKVVYNDITSNNIFYEVYKANITMMQNPFRVSGGLLLGHWTASSASTKIIKKKFYEKYKFEGSKANDVPAIYPIMAEADKIIYYPNLYLYYREVENSLSRANDISSYNSVGSCMIKTFQLMDNIENLEDEKEILFFNNCLTYLLYVLNKIPNEDMKLTCIQDYITKLSVYNSDIFKSMKKSKFYKIFLQDNNLEEEKYDLLQDGNVIDFVRMTGQRNEREELLQEIEEKKSDIILLKTKLKEIANNSEKLKQENLAKDIECQKLQQENLAKDIECQKLQQENLAKDIECQKLQQENLVKNVENEKLQQNIIEIQNEKMKMNENILKANDDNNKLNVENLRMREEIDKLTNEKDRIVKSYENSLSWRMTKPMRKIYECFKKK